MSSKSVKAGAMACLWVKAHAAKPDDWSPVVEGENQLY